MDCGGSVLDDELISESRLRLVVHIRLHELHPVPVLGAVVGFIACLTDALPSGPTVSR